MISHLLGTDHRPSKCAIAAGEYLGELFRHALMPIDGRDPGPRPVYACPCPCRSCKRGKCDHDPHTRAEIEAGRFIRRGWETP